MTLDPRHLPRSYPEMLQDIINLHERIAGLDGENAREMATMLFPAVLIAERQLKRIEQAAIKRMMKP